jgi:Flp pilus assembly protein TadG
MSAAPIARFLSPRRNRAALRRLARRFGASRRGVAAIEFAFVLPLMLSIYFGVVELGQGVMIDRKITELTRSMADLGARSTTISNTEMTDIFDAASTVLMPFTAVTPNLTVSSIVIDNNRVGRVCWSSQRNSTALARGATVTVPDELRIANTSLIRATATYDFTPVIGYVLTGTIRIGGDPIYMRPRLGAAGGTLNIEQVSRENFNLCPTF